MLYVCVCRFWTYKQRNDFECDFVRFLFLSLLFVHPTNRTSYFSFRLYTKNIYINIKPLLQQWQLFRIYNTAKVFDWRNKTTFKYTNCTVLERAQDGKKLNITYGLTDDFFRGESTFLFVVLLFLNPLTLSILTYLLN